MPPTARDAHAPAVREQWAAVGLLGPAAFAIVKSEFLPIGLLQGIAASRLMVTMPGPDGYSV
ncbi:hypothetical protein [Rugamonas sp.]|uniref:hypothetical protein n=1 Tax=Rugamonas sp. TaxID=1926287 RepID=UPI0025EAF0C5|nr:hypothetical protein [Rugamonas sp.]